MNMNNAKPIMICGLPGSGKTTRAKELESKLGAIRFCPDQWMDEIIGTHNDNAFREKLEARMIDLGIQIASSGNNVVLEFGFWSRVERNAVREKAI